VNPNWLGAPPGSAWAHARGELKLDRCLVMGIVNRTPDSFYDGGRMDLGEAVAYAHRLADEGADILDVGAIKAGPGDDVDEHEEARRLIRLVSELAGIGVPLSIETARPAIARAAVDAGAAIINDVSGLANGALAEVCAELGAGLVLMHHGGQIRGRPRHPTYEDVVADVLSEWDRLAGIARTAGVAEAAIVLDPGLDFGKTTYHSLVLMRRLPELIAVRHPVLIAPSRKDVVGETLALPPADRLEGTLALVALSVAAGAAAVRVHDVVAAVRVVRMVEAVTERRDPENPVRGLWG
jgi:dihydropteroate synthase